MPQFSDIVELGRFRKPAGTLLLYWPFAWSLTMSALQFETPMKLFVQLLAAGFFGAIVSHSAGCIWNDIADRDLDAQVERTKTRPLPSNRITVAEAISCLTCHLIVIFSMIKHLEPMAWWIVFMAVVPLAGTYPFMKRVTNFPQVWLGLTINILIFLPPAVLVRNITLPSIILALGGLSWTVWYDTIYAYQDRKDDSTAGIKTITIVLGSYGKYGLGALALVICLSLIAAGRLSGNGAPFFVIGAGGASLLFARNLIGADLDDPSSCFRAFEDNAFLIGPTVFLGLLADYIRSKCM
ncbi:4-hydroxybenzoate polyprenyl transferase [Crepidotus variabilis]|uniref:4-hydroxybenzoate polyprenyltransferase, mitochondrial n=1 Tax=Crepidotus variabilis TaxID=179855 RepID=A0A9P6EB40_9AGAR|nr:4-hydroxybenzoate polyprenyl transferase [Crepidotus variabilis]